LASGYRKRLGPNHVVLEAPGPSKNGYRVVVAVYTDGRIQVPFRAYEGLNTGIPIHDLTTDEFRSRANALFGFDGSEQQARTAPAWLTTSTAEPLIDFCREVADAYAAALNAAATE
jgi:hypothetical protein